MITALPVPTLCSCEQCLTIFCSYTGLISPAQRELQQLAQPGRLHCILTATEIYLNHAANFSTLTITFPVNLISTYAFEDTFLQAI